MKSTGIFFFQKLDNRILSNRIPFLAKAKVLWENTVRCQFNPDFCMRHYGKGENLSSCDKNRPKQNKKLFVKKWKTLFHFKLFNSQFWKVYSFILKNKSKIRQKISLCLAEDLKTILKSNKFEIFREGACLFDAPEQRIHHCERLIFKNVCATNINSN